VLEPAHGRKPVFSGRYAAAVEEGRLAIDDAGHEVFYRRFGAGEEAVVALHGGPGADHEYLLALAGLAGDDLAVVLYDQLGGGRSDRPDDDSLWTAPRFAAELEAVRTGLRLGPMHLYGQSWGGILALEYALTHPAGVRSLVLSNTGASVPEIVQGMARMRADLPPDMYATMLRHEAAGTFQDPEYTAAVDELYLRHFRRATPFQPDRSRRELAEARARLNPVGRPYGVMWGPNEFVCTGNLLDWDVRARLGEIAAPTLVLCGLYDEVCLDAHRTLAEGIPDNEFVIFGNSSHIVLFEKEAPAYLDAVRSFLARVRARDGRPPA
jgi:proline iminopeptidase